MLQRIVFFVIILILQDSTPYKTLTDFNSQLKKVENDSLSTSDVLVGKAMDFVYSNKTIMNLIARELWNVGSVAVDKIVKLKEGQREYLQNHFVPKNIGFNNYNSAGSVLCNSCKKSEKISTVRD